jgi:Right handed beta helix region
MKDNLKRSVMILTALLVIAVSFAAQSNAQAVGTIYYVNCATGNDSNNGLSSSTAWRTTTRANQQTYTAGDQILFARGTVCSGAAFKPVGNGAVGNPVTIADYGTGNLPQIDGVGAHEPAIFLLNVQNYTVRNLDLTQHSQTPQTIKADDGKDSDQNSDEYMRAIVHILGLGPVGVQACGEACTVRNIRLENLKVHDGSWNGIYGGAGYYQLGTNTFGYIDNLVVTGVESRNNNKSGMDVTSTYTKTITYDSTNIQVLSSYFHHNGGDGVVIGPADHILIDGNEASYNGQLRDARLGLWTWDSHDTTIQFNNSHHNMTPDNTGQARDGGGFDCDLGSEDCMMQYNWSHDNEGEGFLIMTWPIGYGYSRGVSHNIQMRYNISERDSKKLACPITIFGGVQPAVIYNNTIYYEPDRLAGSPMFQAEGGAICSSVWGKSGSPTAYIYNNIFITNGTVNPNAVSNNAWGDARGAFTFNRNIWYRVEGGVRFDWGSVMNTWSAWQAQGYDAQGFNTNPLVMGPLGSGPNAYKLQSSSPAINQAQIVTQALRGMGTRDYFGVSIPQAGAYDIGAAESTGSGGPTNTPAPPTNTPTGPTNTPVPTATFTPTPSGSVVMHVFDIYTTDVNGNPQSIFIHRDTIYWRAKIVDQSGNPVSGAAVTFVLYRPDGNQWSTKTATTGADGWALTNIGTVNSSPLGTYTITITNVTKTSATYNPGANLKTSTTFVLQ